MRTFCCCIFLSLSFSFRRPASRPAPLPFPAPRRSRRRTRRGFRRLRLRASALRRRRCVRPLGRLARDWVPAQPPPQKQSPQPLSQPQTSALRPRRDGIYSPVSQPSPCRECCLFYHFPHFPAIEKIKILQNAAVGASGRSRPPMHFLPGGEPSPPERPPESSRSHTR